MNQPDYSIHYLPTIHWPYAEAATRRSQTPRVLELVVSADPSTCPAGNGPEGFITVLLGICNILGGVEALLPTIYMDPESGRVNNRYRIAFWNPECAERWGGLWPGPIRMDLVHPERPLYVNGTLCGMVRWSNKPCEKVSPQLERAMALTPDLGRCWYPLAAGKNQYMDLSDNSPLRTLIVRYYDELMTQLGTNEFYYPQPRFKQDAHGRHYVECASLYASNHLLLYCTGDHISGMGGYVFRTSSQDREEIGHFRAAGGHFTQAGWEDGGNDWMRPNPWVGLMEGAQQYPSVILLDAILASRNRQLQAFTSTPWERTSIQEPRAEGCTENPQCAAYRRSGACRHFRHPYASTNIGAPIFVRPPPLAPPPQPAPPRLPMAPAPGPGQGEIPRGDRCPTRCPAFTRTGYCTHFSDDEY
ncbi:hypothetical protein EV426DRAFT_603572 [Tirmania nivea]|nr:hypothetical protein EV426DRAFT_603572 [Tirmania nivea]